MITRLAIAGYRSLRDVRLELGRLNVVTGPNGSGKSSLYRALKLLADVAQGRVIQSLAAEGGLASTLWAGPESFSRKMKSGEVAVQGTVRRNPVNLRLGFSGSDLGYAIDLGLPGPTSALFRHDPEIKVEAVWTGEVLGRANLFAERKGSLVRTRNHVTGEWRHIFQDIGPFDSMMTHCADPRDAVELLSLRERLRQWRFYDHLRTDREAPSRRPQVGTYTPVLAADGADLASAIQTIAMRGLAPDLAQVVSDAFPGASLDVEGEGGYGELVMRQHGLLRPLRAAELSDGTLRYLLLAAALLSPHPPELMVLNEPEASLHPDLLPPLARLIGRSAERCQLVVVTHAPPLVAALREIEGSRHFLLGKHLGETQVEGGESPFWTWPSR